MPGISVSDWKRLETIATIRAYRTGWPGAWDAFKAALFGRDRLQVVEDVTMSIYVQDPLNEVFIFGGQVEHGSID